MLRVCPDPSSRHPSSQYSNMVLTLTPLTHNLVTATHMLEEARADTTDLHNFILINKFFQEKTIGP